MRILFVLTLMVLSCVGLSACNTMQGLGKDLESAGRTIQDI